MAITSILDTDNSANEVDETRKAGFIVGVTALATDPDGTITYSLSDDAGGLFTIDANTGVVKLANELDAETATSHTIEVTATSSDGTSSVQDFTIGVNDTNEFSISATSDADDATNQVSESAIIGTAVGVTALASDADVTDTVTYSLSANSGGFFAIDATTGVITVADTLDYESATDHTIEVTATSADGSTSQQTFTIDVLDATEIHVSTAAELMAALASATGPTEILLEAGNYGKLDLYDARHSFVKFSDQVIIRSADPDNKASFSGLKLTGVENLSFDGIKFDYVSSEGAATYNKPFHVQKSANISFTNSVFDGDLAHGVDETADGYGTGFGLYVLTSTGINVENNEFFNFMRAGVFGSITDLTVKNNDVHDIRSDGFDFSGVRSTLIEGNHIYNFRTAPGSTDHPDMIQFWTSGNEAPTKDIIIRGNFLDSGDGAWAQSIFMRNELVDSYGYGEEMYYQNILIENNVIHNAHAHGITVGETIGLTIQNNTILHNQDSADSGLVNVPTINLRGPSQNVVVANNIVPRLGLTSSDQRIVENNLVVQRDNPNGENYIGDLFVNALADSNASLTDLQAVSGGLIEQMGVGSTLTHFDTSPEQVTGVIQSDSGTGLQLLTQSLEVDAIYGPSGQVDLAGASYVWDFGDGATSTNPYEGHTYKHPGTYDTTATITLADGNMVELRKTIEVETPIALVADFNTDAADLSDINNEVGTSANVTFEAGQDGNAVRLNGGVVAYKQNSEFFDNSEYTVMFDFKKDVGNEGESGRIINFTGSFVIFIEANGITALMNTSAGSPKLKASFIGVNDADWHRVALTFSGSTGTALLFVDGVEVARATGLDGGIQSGNQSHKFYLGNPFGSGGFDGLIDNVAFLRGAIDADDAASGFAVFDEITGNTATDPVILDDDTVTPPSTDTTTDPVTPDPVIPNTINGTDGNDRLHGTEEVDILNGFAGKDRLYAGGGDDTLDGGDGNDGLYGEAGDDTLLGGAGSDALYGGVGNDALDGGAGGDKLYGGDGNDTLVGGLGKDRLFGEAGDDILQGGDGNDSLIGGDGNDRLEGGADRDLLSGGTGNDVLVGGTGDDDLTGGTGADEFVFAADNGRDKLYDFDAGEDTITLQGLDFVSVANVLDQSFDVRGTLILHLDDDGSGFSWSQSNFVRLVGVDKSDLSDGNIALVA